MRANSSAEPSIGDRLRQLRRRTGLSLDACAQRTGISKAMLGQVERGEGLRRRSALAFGGDQCRGQADPLLHQRGPDRAELRAAVHCFRAGPRGGRMGPEGTEEDLDATPDGLVRLGGHGVHRVVEAGVGALDQWVHQGQQDRFLGGEVEVERGA